MLSKNLNLVLNLLALAAYTTASPVEKRQTTSRYIFSFGDSYSQTGFDITSTKPSASNPFGNPAYPGYTTDNGANWIGVLVESLAPSGTLSYNFASGGATVNASLVAPYENTVLSLIDQTTQFSENVASKPSYAPWTSADSVFAIWLGVNDIGDTYGDGQDQVTIHDEILTSYFNEVQIMYNAGGRNFVFLTVPPINKTPLTIAAGTSAQSQESTQVTAFNALLSTKASSWSNSNSGSKVYVYDTSVPFNTALDNPTAYGASSDGATCYNADGVSCLWWNNLHPGQAIQKLVGQGVYQTLVNGGFF